MFTLLFGVLFFFQAEDGIRDYKVTGVQTCALPISFLAVQNGQSRVRHFRGVGSALGGVSGFPRASVTLPNEHALPSGLRRICYYGFLANCIAPCNSNSVAPGAWSC